MDCAGTWSTWSDCDVTCGSGQQTRTYTVTTPAAGAGAACPASPEGQACDTGVVCVRRMMTWAHDKQAGAAHH